MLKAGSQVTLCDVPVRLDNYVGCSHGCRYCFAQFKTDITRIKALDVSKSVSAFIRGERSQETEAFDFPIPLHWGGMSDPFQPLERKIGGSFQLLKIFADTGYPFIISTKGKLLAEPRCVELLRQCNAVVQISMLSKQYDKYEHIKFDDRLKMLDVLSKNSKRLIIRAQPYIPKLKDDIIKLAKKYQDSGVYGITIEGLKTKSKTTGTVKHFGDFVIPYGRIKSDFLAIKKVYNEHGIKVYGAENRLRSLGDSLSCCGIENLPGFIVNTYNLNHLKYDPENAIPSPGMLKKGFGVTPFKSIAQDSVMEKSVRMYSFKDLMDIYFKSHKDVIG